MQWQDIDRDPSRKTLRQFSGLLAAAFAIIAVGVFMRGGHAAGFTLLLLATLLSGLIGWRWPQWLKPLFVAWMIAAFPIGWLVSHLLLAAVFFLVVTPIGIALRLTGHDPLRLHRHQRASEWCRRNEHHDPRRYLRQY